MQLLIRLSEVTQPLKDLTQLTNGQFIWSEQHDKAFDEVKKLVANYPVLKYYDINDEVTIQCDASKQGLGATLLQNGNQLCLRHENCLQLNKGKHR